MRTAMSLDTSTSANESYKPVDDFSSRPEIRLLQNTVDISEQNTKLVRAEYLPHIALTGGYAISNPNVFNGFQKKFGGVWNVGVMVQMPIWTWFDNKYKIRASKAATSMARMEPCRRTRESGPADHAKPLQTERSTQAPCHG